MNLKIASFIRLALNTPDGTQQLEILTISPVTFLNSPWLQLGDEVFEGAFAR
jgi:hypothetical protein